MLKPPTPGLRPIHLDARRSEKVHLSIPAGSELHVTDEVADQLLAHSPQFKETPTSSDTTEETEPGGEDLEALTRAELIELADQRAVDVDPKAKKAALIAALEAAE